MYETLAYQQQQGKWAARVVRRHPWGFVSLLTTIPFLLLISLSSTIVCPPSKPSALSRFVLTPLGLHQDSAWSAAHKSFCYPANLYNENVLDPYVWPAIYDASDRVTALPVYRDGIKPGYEAAVDSATKFYQGPVKPIVDRTSRISRQTYLKYVSPHLPYWQSRLDALVAPYTSRLAHLHRTHVAPRLSAAQSVANVAGQRSFQTYKDIATHPITNLLAKHADAGYKVTRRKSFDAYTWSRPHAIRAGSEAQRIATEVLGPRVLSGLSWGASQSAKGWEAASKCVAENELTGQR